MSHSQALRLDRRQFVGTCAAASLAPSLSLPLEAAETKPAHTAPLAMWALTGTLKSADVCRQLDNFADAGWGVVLYPRWGLELEYLGTAWFDRIRFIVQEAAARQIEVWLYDEWCWPSGHAKGLVTEGRPDLAAQVLCVERDGQSRIERVAGSANLWMPEATERFLQVTHERYAAAVGEHFGATVRAIFTDEPSLAMYHRPRPKGDTSWHLNWSDALDRALGGDFRRRLAAAGAGLEKSPLWRDYWAAYARVYHDAWTMPIARWCRQHKIALSGHLMGEGTFNSRVWYYGSLRRQLAEFGIPGIDEIHTRCEVDNCEALTLATIAEFPGRERMVEVFALGPPHMTLETMRKMVDLCASCGVDRYVMAICPHDLRGGFFNRRYLGIHGVQQPWFSRYAKVFADYLAESAVRARRAQPLGIAWPGEEELWSVAGPDPRRSEPLKQLSHKATEAAREAIRARLPAAPAAPARGRKLEAQWNFAPLGPNSIRIDRPALNIEEVPADAELSVQTQLVRGLRVNGRPIDLSRAPADARFDLSYCRVPVAKLLRVGENTFQVETDDPQPLPFLPALVLWGRFAVDGQGRIVAPRKTIPLGDWRAHGYPALCGTGRYRTTAHFDRPPARLTIDTGAYPAKVVVNGRSCALRAWSPFEFDLRGAVRAGDNEIAVEITGTLGHLLLADAPPVGLLDVRIQA